MIVCHHALLLPFTCVRVYGTCVAARINEYSNLLSSFWDICDIGTMHLQMPKSLLFIKKSIVCWGVASYTDLLAKKEIESGSSFFPPLGLAILNVKTVLLLHSPPTTSFTRSPSPFVHFVMLFRLTAYLKPIAIFCFFQQRLFEFKGHSPSRRIIPKELG